MKKLYALFCLLFFTLSVSAQPCFPNGIIFTSQQQVNDFAVNNPWCTEIEGNLEIASPSITNLIGLSVITEIQGDLLIHDNAIVTLEGLDNLTVLEGSLMLWGNNNLTSLSGLEGLTTIGNHLAVGANMNSCACPVGNYGLTTLSGLDNITTVGGGVYLYKNILLTNFSGLDKLSVVGGDLAIADNMDLISLSGLESLTSVGGEVSIGINTDELPHGNTNLTNVNGLENLNSIGTNLVIIFNPLLTDISAFNHPITIAGDLSITQNSALSDCAAQAICDYLNMPNGLVEIMNNGAGCFNQPEVEAACATVGVEDRSDIIDFEVYPNPSDGLFVIRGQGILRIRDTAGQLIFQQAVSDELQVDLSPSPSGIYWLEIRNEEGWVVKKLIRR